MTDAKPPFPKWPAETLESMAEIGEAFMDALPEGYSWLQSPAEIIADLQNERDDSDFNYRKKIASFGDTASKLIHAIDEMEKGTDRKGELLRDIANKLRAAVVAATDGPPETPAQVAQRCIAWLSTPEGAARLRESQRLADEMADMFRKARDIPHELLHRPFTI